MAREDDDRGAHFERYRPYLQLLARVQLDRRLQGKVDLSGVVQQTLLEAHRAEFRARPGTSEALTAWLRRILANNLADEVRKWSAGKRDLGRERSLEAELAQSSAKLEGWLAADHSTPSQAAQRNERAVRLAEALAGLPEAQREALILQHWHGCTLAEIAERLDRTPAAAAGLLKRGLERLRTILTEEE